MTPSVTTALLDRVPVDSVGERARAARPGRVLLVVVTALLIGTGWAAYKILAVAWLALAWIGSGVAEGWVMAREDSRRKQVTRGPARAG